MEIFFLFSNSSQNANLCLGVNGPTLWAELCGFKSRAAGGGDDFCQGRETSKVWVVTYQIDSEIIKVLNEEFV